MKTLKDYMTYLSITAQQERRCSQRKGQKQIRAICSQPRIWAASRSDEIFTISSLQAHCTLKGNQEICCTSVDLILHIPSAHVWFYPYEQFLQTA